MDSLHDIIGPALVGIVRPAPLSVEKVLFAWRLSVGPAVARATRVTLGDDRVLVARLADGRWHSELDRQSRMILSRMQDLLGDDTVTRLELRSPAAPRQRARTTRGGRTA